MWAIAHRVAKVRHDSAAKHSTEHSKSQKMYIYFHLIDEETEAWRHEIAYSKPHGMHISRDRNFYPDLDVLKTVFFHCTCSAANY